MDEIVKNIAHIQKRIDEACKKSNRNPEEVTLLLATKTVSPERVIAAINAGYNLIAENRIQELKEKYEPLKSTPHVNHFIGHLQTNKIKELLKFDVACVQSLDRIDLAEKLDQRLQVEGKSIEVLIQVNTSNEESKFGIHPEDAVEFTKQAAQFPSLKIKGLMTIGLFSADEDKVRNCFKLLKSIQQQITLANIPGVEMRELSMGMSGDLEIAIEEGATIVRVGTAIFGTRTTPDSFYWNENAPQ